MADSKVLTVQDVATRLRVHPITVYRLIRSANLPAFRIGRIWRFNAEEIDHWMHSVKRPAPGKNHRRKRFEQFVPAHRRRKHAASRRRARTKTVRRK
jgi:excisionase family DNA binding protein